MTVNPLTTILMIQNAFRRRGGQEGEQVTTSLAPDEKNDRQTTINIGVAAVTLLAGTGFLVSTVAYRLIDPAGFAKTIQAVSMFFNAPK